MTDHTSKQTLANLCKRIETLEMASRDTERKSTVGRTCNDIIDARKKTASKLNVCQDPCEWYDTCLPQVQLKPCIETKAPTLAPATSCTACNALTVRRGSVPGSSNATTTNEDNYPLIEIGLTTLLGGDGPSLILQCSAGTTVQRLLMDNQSFAPTLTQSAKVYIVRVNFNQMTQKTTTIYARISPIFKIESGFKYIHTHGYDISYNSHLAIIVD